MNKLPLIISREYFTRVKKKSFIIMTILGPILMVLVMLVPAIVATVSDKRQEEKTAIIGVIDKNGFYYNVFENIKTEKYTFKFINDSVKDEKALVLNGDIDYLLHIPETDFAVPTIANVYAKNDVPSYISSFLKGVMTNEAERVKLETSGIDKQLLESVKTTIKINGYVLDDQGGEKISFSEISEILGYLCGLLIFMFVFMFGSQVMRGVMEEKSSRIVEVIISSVKPFQLMMGKIIGIGLVGLTQFVLWIVLIFSLYGVFGSAIIKYAAGDSVSQTMLLPSADNALATEATISSSKVSDIVDMISSVNIPVIVISFLFYFLAGYLLFASMFAAIGGAVDNETDTQQFMMPVTIVSIIPVLLSSYIVTEPSGTLAVWLSIIPFTSPITMMMRIPFGIPYWQVLLSVFMLIATFIFMVWVAGKIYRTGILMYGKKVTWKEVIKWIRY